MNKRDTGQWATLRRCAIVINEAHHACDSPSPPPGIWWAGCSLYSRRYLTLDRHLQWFCTRAHLLGYFLLSKCALWRLLKYLSYSGKKHARSMARKTPIQCRARPRNGSLVLRLCSSFDRFRRAARWSSCVCELCCRLLNGSSLSWSRIVSIDRRYQFASDNDGVDRWSMRRRLLLIVFTRSPGRICRLELLATFSEKEFTSLERCWETDFESVCWDTERSVSSRIASADAWWTVEAVANLLVAEGAAPCGWVFSRTFTSERSFRGLTISTRFLSTLRISSFA